MKKTLTILTVTGILITGLTIIASPKKADGGMYILPVGGQVLWPNSSKIPEGFIAEAPDKEVPTNQYPDLYNLIGDNYGTPKEPGDFVLPYNPVPRQSNFSSLKREEKNMATALVLLYGRAAEPGQIKNLI